MSQVDPPPVKQSEREWLRYDPNPADDKRPPIRYSLLASERVEFSGLTPKEREAVEAFLNGGSYIRCVDGRLHAYDVWKSLPDPIDDPICGPHWEVAPEEKQFGGFPESEGWHSPGIIISDLGASYGECTETARRKNQNKVEDCGFVCLRSRRAHDGRYWEQWVLHGLMCAKGPLKEHMAKHPKLNWHQQAEEACRFLARDLGVRFGSMDITIQRWALCCPD